MLTGASWLPVGDAAPDSNPSTWLGTDLIALSLFRVRLVGLHFMELKHAPWSLRLAFEAWVVGVCVSILGMYWLVPTIAAQPS